MDLIMEGKPVAVIVVPDDPLPVVTHAAKELNYHLFKSTGTELSIVAEGKAPATVPRVYLGACSETERSGVLPDSLSPNAWVIRLSGNCLYMAGDDSDGPPDWILHSNRTRVGTLFAVYAFLEKHLGVRWICPGEIGEVIPRRTSISVAEWDETGRPAFVHSRWREGGAMIAGTAGWTSSSARSRFISEQSKWLRRHRFAMGQNMDMAHAFTTWWDRHAEMHPEYFNLLPDGTRRADPTYHGGQSRLISMSVGNPGFQQAVVDHWLATRSPQKPAIDCSENDTSGKCTCTDCLALDEPDPGLGFPWSERLERAREALAAGDRKWVENLGSLSDRYARYYLAVQKLARQHDPEAIVMGYAYANYVDPPRNTPLNDHVIIGVVPPMYFPWTDQKRERNRERWRGWAATGARMVLRPNWMLDGHNMPLIFARKLGEDFRYFAERGLIGTDFDSLTGQYATQGPNLYMLARLHSNPALGVEHVLDEYVSAFGPAKDAVSEYVAYLESVADTPPSDEIPGLHWSYFYREADVIFTPAVMSRARGLIDRALALAAEDPISLRRVKLLSDGLKHAELTLAVQAAYERHQAQGDLEGYREAMERLDAFRSSIESDLGANLCFLEKRESATWDRKLLQLMKQPGVRLPDPWHFRWDPDEIGEEQRWYREDLDVSAWLDIRTDAAWEQQDCGRTWRREHGDTDYDGLAWYRTTFLPSKTPGKPRLQLLFGAVDEACTVWVNGKRLLDRPYPYQGNTDSWKEAFEVDITDVVRYGEPNTVAVRVSDRSGAGGIWRPVWLNAISPAVTQDSSLVCSPGFEDNAEGWRRSIMIGTLDFAVDPHHAHSGRSSGRITCSAQGIDTDGRMKTTVWGRWYQTGIPVRSGDRFELRVWVKARIQPGARVSVWVTGTGKGTMAADIADTGGRWVEVTIDNIVPKKDELGLYLNLRDGLGTAWFDDVALTAAPPGE
jgi:hypothetical protein